MSDFHFWHRSNEDRQDNILFQKSSPSTTIGYMQQPFHMIIREKKDDHNGKKLDHFEIGTGKTQEHEKSREHRGSHPSHSTRDRSERSKPRWKNPIFELKTNPKCARRCQDKPYGIRCYEIRIIKDRLSFLRVSDGRGRSEMISRSLWWNEYAKEWNFSGAHKPHNT